MAKLPPMNLLLTVEAAARLGSFRLAAEELHITPSAVSHRIRTVEDKMGSSLFRRAGQGIEPTENALELSRGVAMAVQEIQSVWDSIHQQTAERTIHISCMSQFASHFILPELHKFKERHSNIALELTNQRDLHGLETGAYDISVCVGIEPVATFWSEPLLRLTAVPVVSPAIREDAFRDGKLYGPLLSYKADPNAWIEISEQSGMEIHEDADEIFFGSLEAAAAAAVSGVGVALLPEWKARTMADSGSVEQLLNQSFATEMSYWLVVRSGEESYPVIAAFRSWLTRQLESFHPCAPA